MSLTNNYFICRFSYEIADYASKTLKLFQTMFGMQTVATNPLTFQLCNC